jgi:predicted site-specific integrase-resolvase
LVKLSSELNQKQEMTNKKLIKPDDLCEMLGVCRRTLTRYEDQGLIRSIKLNARVFRFCPEDVEAMIENLRGKAA